MKKAVLYARVSSDLQKKEKTIDSQVLALKKQIKEGGDVLIKEYIDDGYSGARLDRPALDLLRKDIKTGLFETIYFLNTDRIARDVAYQNIIIGEILKYKKQIIINGQDYVHNPENKFTLTILGAVAELERAKIIERTSRGRQLRLAQGKLLGPGHNTYGYDYYRKTPISEQRMEINKIEAAHVRYIFNEYAKGNIGMNPILRKLEERGAKTKNGKTIWRKSLIKCILNNHTYTGIKYYNKMRRIREYKDPIQDIKFSSSKLQKRDRIDWVGVAVPAIISKELFDKVQERMQYNRKKYRNPRFPHLLTSLMKCGYCGGSFYCYRRYYVDRRSGKIVHRFAYKCNWSHRHRNHHQKTKVDRCYCKEITAETLENKIFTIIKETMIDSTTLRNHMDFLKERGKTAQIKLEKELKKVELKIQNLSQGKRRIIDIYASGELAKEEYVKRCIQYDEETNDLVSKRAGIVKRIPLLHKADTIDTSIKHYCEGVRLRLSKSNEFDSKRQFLLSFIEKITYWNDRLALQGVVPIIPEDEKRAASQIEFCIQSKMDRTKRNNI